MLDDGRDHAPVELFQASKAEAVPGRTFSSMDPSQRLKALRGQAQNLKFLRAALARAERKAAKARELRGAQLKRSKTLRDTAAAADAALKQLIGKRGNVEHVLEALATPREEGGFSVTEKSLIATGAANLRHRSVTSRRFHPRLLTFFSALGKCGGAKSALNLMRGPGPAGSRPRSALSFTLSGTSPGFPRTRRSAGTTPCAASTRISCTASRN